MNRHTEKRRKVEGGGEGNGGEEGGGEEGGREESGGEEGRKAGTEKGKEQEGSCSRVENFRGGPELGLVSDGTGWEAWISEAEGQLRACSDELVRGRDGRAVRVGILLLLLREEGVGINGN